MHSIGIYVLQQKSFITAIIYHDISQVNNIVLNWSEQASFNLISCTNVSVYLLVLNYSTQFVCHQSCISLEDFF